LVTSSEAGIITHMRVENNQHHAVPEGGRVAASPHIPVLAALYSAYFSVNSAIVRCYKRVGLPTLGAIHGMLSLESGAIARGLRYTKKKYAKTPESFGLNTFFESDKGKTPILMLHGAAGSWNYMGDVAVSLREKGRPVFVVDMGGGIASEEKRLLVHSQIEEIREKYQKQFGMACPDIDLVAHSMGGVTAYNASFDTSTSAVTATGDLEFSGDPIAKEGIGRVYTMALPYSSSEVLNFEAIGKGDKIFTLLAKYDALMGDKESAARSRSVNAGHIGIVFSEDAIRKITTEVGGE